MFKALFRKNPAFEAGRALYARAVAQARLEPFYENWGVPDTVEGRFEMVALHVYLLMRRLKGEGATDLKSAKEVSQCLLDAMFRNLDDALREMGVGDLVVGKKIRALAENFYGRLGAYEAAFGAGDAQAALAKALGRNVYENEEAPEARLLADYVGRADRELAAQPLSRIAGGIAQFPAPQPVEA